MPAQIQLSRVNNQGNAGNEIGESIERKTADKERNYVDQENHLTGSGRELGCTYFADSAVARRADASESERLEKLERAVEQLQKRNAELEAEVISLKKADCAVPEGKMKTKVTYDGKE